MEDYVNGTFDLVKNLPQEVAGLPQNVSLPVHTPACTYQLMQTCAVPCPTLHMSQQAALLGGDAYRQKASIEA